MSNIINNNHIQYIPQSSNISNNNCNNIVGTTNAGKTFAITPVHQRTRSLPLTEETAIRISQSPPQPFNLQKYSTGSSSGNAENPTLKLNNNSMESIIEDQNSMDFTNNNSCNTSILKQLSKMANPNFMIHNYTNMGGNGSSSPLLLRKKRHHNVISASLRSTYLIKQNYHTRKSNMKESIVILTFHLIYT